MALIYIVVGGIKLFNQDISYLIGIKFVFGYCRMAYIANKMELGDGQVKQSEVGSFVSHHIGQR